MNKHLITIPCLILALCACGGNKGTDTAPEYDPTGVKSIVLKNVPFRMLNFDTVSQSYYVMKASTAKYYVINNETIPYMSFSTFVSENIRVSGVNPNLKDYEYSFDGETVTINNPANDSYMTLNTLTRVVTYYDYELFTTTNPTTSMPFTGAVFGSKIFRDSLTEFTYYEGKETVSFSLADYSIPEYVHRGEVYLPYETMCAIFGLSTGDITYAGDAFYYYDGAMNALSISYNQYIRDGGTDWITEEYLTECYNTLAFSIDKEFGLDKRQSRLHEGETKEYLKDGAYALLAPYKERLLSADPDVSNLALSELVNHDLDDGGHTMYVSTNIMSDSTYTRLDASGEDSANTLSTLNGIAAMRKEKKISAADVLGEEVSSPNGYYKEYGDTAYIQFDGFTMGLKEYTAESVSAAPYYTDTITLFNYANEQIQTNQDIKNVVIDLSGNGGGVMFASEFVASWVCGGNDGSIRETVTGSVIDYRIEADVNFDGVFNSYDYLPSGMNVYVMVSNGSFSCGNKLPCNIKDNRPENTYFIGSRTGGGSCAITYLSFGYLGGHIRISSTKQIGRTGSTQENFVTNEAGVTADFHVIENSDYSGFCDLDSIITDIRSNSSK